MSKINKYIAILIISLFSTAAKSETITMPSSLTADTTAFVLLSSSGTAPSISKDFSAIIRSEAGFDWNFNSGWNLSSTLDRINKDGFGHQNYLQFNAFKSF